MFPPVETIGTCFGGIPQMLPRPHLPEISYARVMAVLPNALSFALLGCIESLLSAVVADSMTGPAPPFQLRTGGPGACHIASPLFGGVCVSGNIARTATNTRVR